MDALLPSVLPPQTGFECPICLDWIAPQVSRRLSGCGHTLCVKCLIDYLRWAGNERRQPCCPTGRCKFLILEIDARSVFPDEAEFAAWKQQNFQAWLYSQPNIYNCMTPDCPFAISLPLDRRQFACPICLEMSCLDCLTTHTAQSCHEFRSSSSSSSSPAPPLDASAAVSYTHLTLPTN